MSSKLVLRSSGFEYHVWSDDLYKEHEIIKKHGKYIVKNKDGRTVRMSNSEKEARQYFWMEEEISSMCPKLREKIYLDPGVTLQDLYNAIQKFPDLCWFLETLYPRYRCSDLLEEGPENNSEIQVWRSGTIKNNHLDIRLNSNIEPTVRLGYLPIAIHDTLTIFNEDEDEYENEDENEDEEDVVAEGKWSFSLFDLLHALFNSYQFYGEVIITKDGLIDDLGNHVVNTIEALTMPCKIDDDVTLQDIFDMVERDNNLSLFISAFSWCDINAFQEESKKSLPSNFEKVAKYLGIRKMFDRGWNEEDLEIFKDFYGVGEDGDTHSMSFYPVNEFSDLFVRCSEEVILDGKKYINNNTLIDILDAIFYDISFYGHPGERDIIKNEVMEKYNQYLELLM